MSSAFEKRLNAVDQARLTPLVRRALEDETIEVADWGWQPVAGGFVLELENSFGIYRFRGTAHARHRTLAWSLILKTIGPTSSDSSAADNNPANWLYWKREVLAYQSGLLDDLPGDLVAPRCFSVVEYPGHEFWIWLEDIAEEEVPDWSLPQYGLAARHLGQFNGAYVVSRSRPKAPWLSRGRVRDWLEEGDPALHDLRRLSQHPWGKSWLSGDSVERTLALWAKRDPLLQLLDRLPKTLCHHDAFRRNLMSRQDNQGRTQTVAIDWAMMGTGVIGEEIATSVGITLQFLEVEAARSTELDAAVFAGYLAGLGDAGWSGDPRIVRFGFTATAALYIGVASVGMFLAWILDQGEELVEQNFGHSLDDVLAQWATLQHFLLDLGDEALGLAKRLE